MKKITKYVAENGKEFKSQKECERYEKNEMVIQEIESIIDYELTTNLKEHITVFFEGSPIMNTRINDSVLNFVAKIIYKYKDQLKNFLK